MKCERTGNKSPGRAGERERSRATGTAHPPLSFLVRGIRYQYARYDSATSRAHPSTYCGLTPSTHAAVFVPTDTAVAHPENTFPRWLLLALYTSALRPKLLNCFRHKSRYSRRIYIYIYTHARITFLAFQDPPSSRFSGAKGARELREPLVPLTLPDDKPTSLRAPSFFFSSFYIIDL